MKTEVPDGIEEGFLKLPYRQFIQDYEIHLSEFMEYRRIFSEEESEPLELEKQFLGLSLDFLRERNEEVLKLDSLTMHSFCESKGITLDELFYREDLRPEFDEWDGLNSQFDEVEESELMGYNYKIHFLTIKAKRLGLVIEWGEKIRFNETIRENPIDLSNTRANEKLIYLKELGIIDFLMQRKDIGENANLLGTIFSAITDEKPTTLNSNINALIRPNETTANKNPMNSKKVSEVRNKLRGLGLNL